MELTRDYFNETVLKFYDWCEYPAVKYKILLHFLDAPRNDSRLEDLNLRERFLYSDIVNELYETQSFKGNWGALFSKDYSAKALFPTTAVAIDRCLYIGLTLEDREILSAALNYLEDYLLGKNTEKLYDKNERAIPWQFADIANLTEAVKPYNPLCDTIWNQWFYIVSRTFGTGVYSYETDAACQHDMFLTREKRLVPLPISLLLKRHDEIPAVLEKSMLDHYGKHAYEKGHFWDKNLINLPDSFQNKYCRRWFFPINYINQFKNNREYLDGAINWLMKSQIKNGFWDWGPQVKDPWGYFYYLSTTKSYAYNRIVNCTAEVLTIFKKYLDNNLYSK